ncbi:hypothetical protein BWI96_02855 [Siphonobacter sp. SORGH_AS_0500]|uniref:hypothetical protein n=1 Tax=Siphonobacter sp. SORGH_AS_0500 TaxID=1864824 RepID=UPI000CA7A57E|nr:hypothetical protein [Siphonobacter sp. SORGH_AS_0500]PKK38203.1 hypothetical protein BWI96_02855 [Siphonobacter sp. SORGH_AS_0500]
MKKLFALFLLGTMVSLAACQEKKTESTESTDSSAVVVDTTTAVDTVLAVDTTAADTAKNNFVD